MLKLFLYYFGNKGSNFHIHYLTLREQGFSLIFQHKYCQNENFRVNFIHTPCLLSDGWSQIFTTCFFKNKNKKNDRFANENAILFGKFIFVRFFFFKSRE